jgi:hypothetical protein
MGNTCCGHRNTKARYNRNNRNHLLGPSARIGRIRCTVLYVRVHERQVFATKFLLRLEFTVWCLGSGSADDSEKAAEERQRGDSAHISAVLLVSPPAALAVMVHGTLSCQSEDDALRTRDTLMSGSFIHARLHQFLSPSSLFFKQKVPDVGFTSADERAMVQPKIEACSFSPIARLF